MTVLCLYIKGDGLNINTIHVAALSAYSFRDFILLLFEKWKREYLDDSNSSNPLYFAEKFQICTVKGGSDVFHCFS